MNSLNVLFLPDLAQFGNRLQFKVICNRQMSWQRLLLVYWSCSDKVFYYFGEFFCYVSEYIIDVKSLELCRHFYQIGTSIAQKFLSLIIPNFIHEVRLLAPI